MNSLLGLTGNDVQNDFLYQVYPAGAMFAGEENRRLIYKINHYY